jgi:hypothetical protein
VGGSNVIGPTVSAAATDANVVPSATSPRIKLAKRNMRLMDTPYSLSFMTERPGRASLTRPGQSEIEEGECGTSATTPGPTRSHTIVVIPA